MAKPVVLLYSAKAVESPAAGTWMIMVGSLVIAADLRESQAKVFAAKLDGALSSAYLDMANGGCELVPER